MKKIIVILGPTASGKSKLAIKLAHWLSQERIKKKFKIEGAEIICADSRQVYKGLDIGTDKVSQKEREKIPHYLLDVASPKRKFTVFQYRKLALKILEKIFKKNKIPIFCGGTYFYIKAVIDGISLPEVPPNWKLRKELEKKDTKELFEMLKKLDPQRAKTIEKENKRRLIRAIEIVKKLGRVPPQRENPLPYPVLFIARDVEKNELKKRIEKRFLKWLKKGLIKEVKKLKESSLSFKRIEEFGLHYKIISQYLQKKITKKEMIEKSIKSIQDYAKEQLKWLKKERRLHWIKNDKTAKKLVKDFLEEKIK